MTFDEFIATAKEGRFIPLIFIETCLLNLSSHREYTNILIKKAKEYKIEIVNENSIENKNFKRKYLIIRYGDIGRYNEARLLKSKSKILSGCLEV